MLIVVQLEKISGRGDYIITKLLSEIPTRGRIVSSESLEGGTTP